MERKNVFQVNLILEALFESYGKFVFRNRWVIAIVCFLINGLFGLGLLSLHRNNDIEDMYLNRNTDTRKLMTRLEQIFPDGSENQFQGYSSIKSPMYVELVVIDKHKGNILSTVCINETKHLIKYVENLTISSEYMNNISYKDICAKFSSECVIAGRKAISLMDDCSRENGTCQIDLKSIQSQDFKHKLSDMLQYIGNPVIVNNIIIEATGIKLRFYLRQDSAGRVKDARRWQKKFLAYMAKLKTINIDFVYCHSKSFYDELGNDTFQDIRYFALTFTIFYFYCGFFISGGDCVTKTINIGRMGTLVVPLSVLGVWGLITGSGIEFTNSIGVMPYVAVYFEVNNILMTMYKMSECPETSKAVDRVGTAVRTIGIPVTMTTLIYSITFVVGVTSDFKVMEVFSIYTIGTILVSYVNHMTFFIACIAIHEKRIDDNRHFCTCQVIKTKEQGRKEGRSCCVMCWCTGGNSILRESTASRMERFSRKLLSHVVLQKFVVWTILVIFIVYIGVSSWQTVYFKVNVFQKDSVTKDSYFSKYQKMDEVYFKPDFYVSFVLPGNIDYLDNITDDILPEVESMILSNRNVETNFMIYWFQSYKSSPYCNLSSQEAFTESLTAFLAANSQYKGDIAFDENNQISHSRCYAKTSHIQTSTDIMDLKRSLLNLNQVSSNVNDLQRRNRNGDNAYNDVILKNSIILHSPLFVYTDSRLTPLKEYLIMVGAQVGVSILLITLVYRELVISIHTFVWFISAQIGFFGFLSLLDIEMTPVTMIASVLGSNYIVDVIIHTLVSFINTLGTDRKARAHSVLSTTSVVLSNTTFASFLGLLLAFVEHSYVFITVMKVLLVASAIACVHSCLFIPVGLSLFGTHGQILLINKKDSDRIRTILTITRFPDAKQDYASTSSIDCAIAGQKHEYSKDVTVFENKGFDQTHL